MNKELYINKLESINKMTELQLINNRLGYFLENHQNKFKTSESITALKIIKEYFITKEQELTKEELNYRLLEQELKESCKHEIAIKGQFGYKCMICNFSFSQEVPKETIISVDTTKDPRSLTKIKKIFKIFFIVTKI